MALKPLEEWQYRTILWSTRSSALLSLTSLSFVVGSFLFSSRFQSSINRLIFYASLGNIVSCVAVLMSMSPINHGPDLPYCQIQAFVIDWYDNFIFTPPSPLCLCSES